MCKLYSTAQAEKHANVFCRELGAEETGKTAGILCAKVKSRDREFRSQKDSELYSIVEKRSGQK